MNQLRPNEQEKEALTLFYNRFYALFDEITDDVFLTKPAKIRFLTLKEAFSVYKEVLSYEPIKDYLRWMKAGGRPIFDGIIADDLFSFIRNLLLHFPIFDTWDDVYITKDLATWVKSGQINTFLKRCHKYQIDGQGSIKYRIWEEKIQKMTYFSVNFPEQYEQKHIYLKDIITEEVGSKFCMALMRKILDSQVENSEKPSINIMSQVYMPQKNNI